MANSKKKPTLKNSVPRNKLDKVSSERKSKATRKKRFIPAPVPVPVPVPCGGCCDCSEASSGSLLYCNDGVCEVIPPPTYTAYLVYDPLRVPPANPLYWERV
jgi:hypothetical protein